MSRRYSRRASIQARKNKKKAYFLLVTSFVLLGLFFFYGISLITKFSSFILDFKGSSTPIEVSDATPPSPPHLSDPPAFTNALTLDLKGNAEPGSIIEIFVNDEKTETLANKEGGFTTTISLYDGENFIYAYAVDASGNKSLKSSEYNIIYDNEKPKLEISEPQSGQSFYGQAERNISVKGESEPKVKVNVNGRNAIVNDSGIFSIEIGLNDGSNELKIVAEDQAGNKTETTVSVNYAP